MKPILRDLPIPIETERLLLRPFLPGDGTLLNEAVVESFAQLNQWMHWARTVPTIAESEEAARVAYAQWILRKALALLIFDKQAQTVIGATGFNRINWSVPSMAIGYWIRTSKINQGFAKESVHALTRYAFDTIGVHRLEIRCDPLNVASMAVARKGGFVHEATLRNDKRLNGTMRDTAIFVQLNEERSLLYL